MTKTKNIILSAVVLLLVNTSFGQSIDEERMERDLKVAENILSTLSNENSRFRLYDKVESNYIPDFGVVFSIPRPNNVYILEDKQRIVYGSGSSGTSYVITSTDEADEKDEEAEVVESSRRSENRRGELEEEAIEKVKEQMTLFLVDYADLIGQLKPSHRIVVQTRGRNDRLFFNGRQVGKGQPSLSAQIMKSDLTSHKQGKMSRDELIKKISFTTNEDKETSKDVELFATIFSRLYEPDLSDTYYLASRSMGYTQLDGLGITFNLKMYSSSSNEGLHTITATGESGLTQEERDDKVAAMYPEFVRTFKENIIDYGRTIKSLKPDEMLVFKVKLTECRGCDMPDEIEVMVKGKVLQDYDKGSLSREEGVKQINVKKKSE